MRTQDPCDALAPRATVQHRIVDIALSQRVDSPLKAARATLTFRMNEQRRTVDAALSHRVDSPPKIRCAAL